MKLQKPGERKFLAEGPEKLLPAHRRHVIRQGARLAIGAAGIAGGVFLLTTNVLSVIATTGASIPWLPLSANIALLFGSAMFLREYRRASREAQSQSPP